MSLIRYFEIIAYGNNLVFRKSVDNTYHLVCGNFQNVNQQ